MKVRAKRTPRLASEARRAAVLGEPRQHRLRRLVTSRAGGRSPNLKPTTRSISLRLPLRMLERIKAEANSRDVPYQSLIKVWLEEKLSA